MEPTPLVGSNAMSLSKSTMKAVVQQWLNATVPGTAIEVTSIDTDGEEFTVEFSAKPKPPTGG